ncbi:DUF461 domain-containing protein [Streptomyces sp. NPDC059785]|uniref:DUF461 domain-containing protein n=1 Tax=Streptomyces sp. NPDC059785 TaxID=3346945 RepID=UPI00364DA8BC
MSSSLRRGALAAAAIAFSIASLAACGAGSNAQTLEIKPDNAATTVGDIKVQNALVITQPNAETGGPAAVAATLFNNGTKAQTLDSITVEGQTAEIKPAKGSGKVSIPAGGYVTVGGKDNASAVLSSGDVVKDGNAQKVTFDFSKTGAVSLRAFVVPAEHQFTDWGPSDIPEAPGASASPSESEGTGSASGKPSAGSSPSGEASGEASGEDADESSDTPSDTAGSASASDNASGH